MNRLQVAAAILTLLPVLALVAAATAAAFMLNLEPHLNPRFGKTPMPFHLMVRMHVQSFAAIALFMIAGVLLNDPAGSYAENVGWISVAALPFAIFSGFMQALRLKSFVAGTPERDLKKWRSQWNSLTGISMVVGALLGTLLAGRGPWT